MANISPQIKTQPETPSSFAAQLESWRSRMEIALAARLPKPTVVPMKLHAAIRYSVLGGGKRVRPALLFATARTLGLTEDEVEAAACAIELIHVYSLIHDDLPAMDDDDLRRGRLTCHKAFGEDVAILAGDGLYAEAFRLLVSEQRGDPAHVLAAARELAAATGVQGMVGGQYIDVTETAPEGAAGLRR